MGNSLGEGKQDNRLKDKSKDEEILLRIGDWGIHPEDCHTSPNECSLGLEGDLEGNEDDFCASVIGCMIGEWERDFGEFGEDFGG